MSSGRIALYCAGAALLVAYLAGANMPGGTPPESRDRVPPPAPGPASIAAEVGSQAARLQARMAQAPVPDQHPRNPFSFGAAPRAPHQATIRAAVADDAPAPALPAVPSLTLMGIAEETTAQGPRRTAIIAGDGDALFMVGEGQAVGDRYKVSKIGADAVELEDLLTKAYRRLALR